MERIELPIHTERRCAGKKLSVRLQTDAGQTCTTTERMRFSHGERRFWSGSQLGSCQSFPMDNTTRIQLLSRTNTWYYCVGGLVNVTTTSADYLFEIPDGHRTKENNAETYQIFSHNIKSKYLCTRASQFF